MLPSIKALLHGERKTFWLYFNMAIYILLMIVTTIYCYGRLDYVRSYSVKEQTTKNP